MFEKNIMLKMPNRPWALAIFPSPHRIPLRARQSALKALWTRRRPSDRPSPGAGPLRGASGLEKADRWP